MKTKILGLLAVGLLAGPLTASASLVGREFTAGYYVPDNATLYPSASFSPATFSVGEGVETVGLVEDVTTLSTDLTADSLSVTFNTRLIDPVWTNFEFNGIIFNATLPHGITAASVDAVTTLAGFDNSRVTFDANRILLNWANLAYDSGTAVKINFAFSRVPEPGTLALLGLGLLGLVMSRRKRAA